LTPQGKTRKSYEEIVDAIMEALPVNNYITIEEVARKTGSSWETVYRWLKLIAYIQDKPRVERMKSPLGRGEVYSRERAEYGAKKV
jgi:predicted DNA-binding transcriptional regulator AlpA